MEERKLNRTKVDLVEKDKTGESRCLRVIEPYIIIIYGG